MFGPTTLNKFKEMAEQFGISIQDPLSFTLISHLKNLNGKYWKVTPELKDFMENNEVTNCDFISFNHQINT